MSHGLQLDAPPSEYLPAAQVAQPSFSDFWPAPVPCFPEGQSAQVSLEDAPAAPLYFPMRQSLQTAAPFVASNVPYLPCGQSVEQLRKGSADEDPSAHALHSVLEEMFANLPCTQSMQSASKLLAASLLLYLPLGQSKHCCLLVAARTSLYFPRGQGLHAPSRVDLMLAVPAAP